MIPVIVVSARDARANKERALKAGAKAYVQRPWNDSELLTLIRLQLGQTVQAVAQPVSFSKNRLNVAISRAKCLAVLMPCPDLLKVKCHTPEQMELVNTLC